MSETPDDSTTIDLLKSFPSLKKAADTNETADADDVVLTSSALDGILPSVPNESSNNNDDDDDDDGGLVLPSAPSSQLPRGIKPGSEEEVRSMVSSLVRSHCLVDSVAWKK